MCFEQSANFICQCLLDLLQEPQNTIRTRERCGVDHKLLATVVCSTLLGVKFAIHNAIETEVFYCTQSTWSYHSLCSKYQRPSAFYDLAHKPVSTIVCTVIDKN